MARLTLFLCCLFISFGVYSQTTIWSVDFETGYADNDASAQDNNLPAGADWTKSGSPSNWWRVESDNFLTGSLSMSGRNTDGVMTWTSETITISGYSNVSISINIKENGYDNDGDYIRTYYDIGGGDIEFGVGNGEGNFGGTANNTITGLSGTTLTITVLVNNDDGNDRGIFDDILVQGTPGGGPFSYTGPGGVGDNTTNELWLIAEGNTFTDAGSTAAADGEDLQQWNDVSGNDNHAIQTTASFKPELKANAVNGFSSVDFVGNAVRIMASGINSNDELTMYIVFQVNGYTANNNDGIIHAGPSGHNFSTSAATKTVGTWINTSTEEIWGRGIQSNSSQRSLPQNTAISEGQYYVLTQDYDGSDISQYVNGTVAGTVSYDGTLNSWTDFGIGRQGSEAFNGEIAEIVVYDEHTNAAMQIIINNYLAAKYNISLDSDDLYDEDDNGDYDYEVAGIGQASDGTNHQDAQGTGIVRVNSPAALDDDDFFIWGHDNGGLTYTSSDIPSTVNNRIERVWRVSETGEVGNITISFDISDLPGTFDASSLRLLIDSDNDGTFSDESDGVGVLSGASDLGSNVFSWTGVDIDNNERFSLGLITEGYLGPGGVGEIDGTGNLSIWLDATTITGQANGSNMGTWSDMSGNGNDALVGTAAPNYLSTGGGNGLPAVNFEDGRTENFRVSTNAEVIPTQAISVFVAGNYENGSDSWACFINSSDDDAWSDGWGIGEDNNTGDMIHYVDDYNGTFCNTTISTDYGTDHVWSLLYSTDEGVIYGYKSENECTDNFAGPISYDTGRNDDLLIGAGPNNGGPNYFLTGDITEIALYDSKVNDAQRIIIHNYLAAKYDISLSSNDVYDEDDNGEFDFDVAGIGQAADGSAHIDAQGTGIVRINNISDLDDGEFYIWGHDNGALSSFGETDLPDGIESRLARIWRGSETGDVGTYNISFDLSGVAGGITASDLRLLIDSDNDGEFIDEPTGSLIAGATNTSGSIYEWTNVSLGNNTRFTLGSIDAIATPLPIELGDFRAKAIHEKHVLLEWETLTEINNDYFTIERSLDGENWEIVSQVKGFGTSTRKLKYRSHDYKPYLGISYYRLKQTDFDGEYSYSKPRVVQVFKVEEKLEIYPVPSSGRITILSNFQEIKDFRVFNMLAKDVTLQVNLIGNSEGRLDLDISQLEPGIYVLRTSKSSSRFIKIE